MTKKFFEFSQYLVVGINDRNYQRQKLQWVMVTLNAKLQFLVGTNDNRQPVIIINNEFW